MRKLEEAQIKGELANTPTQPDIVPLNNPKVEKAIAEKVKKEHTGRTRSDVTLDPHRLMVRMTLMESPESDPNGFERVIGNSDLLSVNFLTRGLRAAAAVCRIRVPTQGGE